MLFAAARPYKANTNIKQHILHASQSNVSIKESLCRTRRRRSRSKRRRRRRRRSKHIIVVVVVVVAAEDICSL